MQVVNHGIPEDVIRKMMDVSGRFFDLPIEERAKLMRADMKAPVRYGTSFSQTTDSVFCWRDFLKLQCHPLSDFLPHWPLSPLDFRYFITTIFIFIYIHSLFNFNIYYSLSSF